MELSGGLINRKYYLGSALLLLVAPLCGSAFLDRPFSPYLQFPPRTEYIGHAPFSWSVFILLSVFVATACMPVLYRLIRYKPPPESIGRAIYAFPIWGWLGCACVIITWILAWSRFPFFKELQRYTFTPLWIGYILVVNALTYRRQGNCLMLRYPRFFLILFPCSSLFWWYFEYLNRFVQNWHYMVGDNVSALEYVVHASICFSTVLPAVVSTRFFLNTYPRLTGAFASWTPLRIKPGKRAGRVLLLLAALCLGAMVLLPDILFSMVWVAPLISIAGVQLVSGGKGLFSDLERGNWQNVVIPALAGLLCGFFWEMWNWNSLAHWAYSIPYVDRFRIFEMPVLGYAGYLPFGVVCIETSRIIKSCIFH